MRQCKKICQKAKNFQTLLYAGSQVGGHISFTPIKEEDTSERLIRSPTNKKSDSKIKKKSNKWKGKKRKAMVKKRKSVDMIKKGKNQWLGNKGKKKNRKKKIKDVQKKLKDRSKTRQSIVFTGENCTFIDFASVRTLGAECADGTKMVVKNK